MQLCANNDSNFDNIILWQNPRPSSTRYCRPIKLLFEKETTEVARREIKSIENQIQELVPTNLEIDSKDIIVEHHLIMSMGDGQICNAVMEVSSAQKCYVCGATPKYMNDLENTSKRDPDVRAYSFGLSHLHALIRCFETILHISYRMDIKKWQVRGQEKETVQARKQIIEE